jgi:hypothetical protein
MRPEGVDITIRSTRSTVTFQHAFVMGSAGTVQDGRHDALPAGSYELTVEEELLPGLSFAAYHRIATYLTIRVRPGTTEMRLVDPHDLERALCHDLTHETASTDSDAALSPR